MESEFYGLALGRIGEESAHLIDSDLYVSKTSVDHRWLQLVYDVQRPVGFGALLFENRQAAVRVSRNSITRSVTRMMQIYSQLDKGRIGLQAAIITPAPDGS